MELSNLQKEVKTQLEKRLETKGTSQNELAKSLGISPATLSNILTDKWEKINDSMLLSIQSKLKPNKWQIVETDNFKRVNNACMYAKEQNKFVGVIGKEGYGKTLALQHFFNNNPNTYMITCQKGMNPKQFFKEIGYAMGVNANAPIYELKKIIIKELNKRENPLIIIDEISKIPPTNLMDIQDLWDGIKHNSGLIIAGAGYFKENFLKLVINDKTGMPELYTRICVWAELVRPTKKEYKAILEANNVDFLQDDILPQIPNYRVLDNVISNIKFGMV